MKTSKVLKEEIAACLDKVSAVTALCDKDGREPTSDEQTLVNELIGADGASGKLAQLKAQLTQSEAFERELAAQASKRLSIPAGGVHHEQAGVEDSSNPFASIKVPLSAQRHAVRGFDGPEKAKAAFAFGQFLFACAGSRSAESWVRDHLGVEIYNGMTEGADSGGGVLVPDQFVPQLIRLVNQYGAIRQYARSVPMSGDTLIMPRRTGGLTAYAIGETTAPTESTATFDAIRLVAKDFGVLTYFSKNLDADSAIAVAGNVMEEIALAFAYKEDACGFSGDGTSTYNGIVGLKNALAAGSTYTAASGNTAFSTLDLEDFEGMVATLPNYALPGAAWYIHRSGWATSMLRLAAAAGGNTTREISGGVDTMFLGYPVRFVEVMNSTLSTQTSTSGLCYFGNLPQAVYFGDRAGVTVSMSEHVQFTTRQVAVLGVERFDVNVHDAGTSSVSGGVVMLKTPAS